MQLFQMRSKQKIFFSAKCLHSHSSSSGVCEEHYPRTQHSRDSSCKLEDFLRYTDLVSTQLHVGHASVVFLGSVHVSIHEKVHHVLVGSWMTD